MLKLFVTNIKKEQNLEANGQTCKLMGKAIHIELLGLMWVKYRSFNY